MPSPSPSPTARGAALALLGQVLGRGRPLNDTLADGARNGGLGRLDPRDRAFARLLATTVLRRLGQLDRVIGVCVERPLPDAHQGVHDVLRLGAAQLLFLSTPAHAAVDRTVALVPRRSARLRGLVNAVLRRLAREGPALIADDDAPRLNTPDWLWRSWSATHGEAAARAIAEVHLEPPPLDFTVADPARAEVLARALDGRVLPTGTVRRGAGGPGGPGGIVADLPGYQAGEWWVQDAAAALPARVLLSGARARGRDPAGLRALDLCAAPGGKTAQLAAAGVAVTAVDRAAKRLHLLERNLQRLGLEAETVTDDCATWRPPARADLVLLDAPCSGTGTLRRHPDIAHLKTAGMIPALVAAQARLLRAAAQMVSPGGVLVYAVCSLQAEEGPEIVSRFLDLDPGFRRLPIGADEVGGLDQILTPDGDLGTLPCHLAEHGGMDGFYAARLVAT
jgi:16S rRNA (cytosine967-C5)-methyltransferase